MRKPHKQRFNHNPNPLENLQKNIHKSRHNTTSRLFIGALVCIIPVFSAPSACDPLPHFSTFYCTHLPEDECRQVEMSGVLAGTQSGNIT